MGEVEPAARRRREAFGTLGQKGKKYYPSYVGPDKKRHTSPISYSTINDARGWLSGQRTAIEAGIWTPETVRVVRAGQVAKRRDNILFEDYARDFIDRRRNRDARLLSPNTVTSYEWHLRSAFAPLHGKSIPYITRRDVENWWAGLTEGGTYTKASQAYSLLSTIMKRAVADKLILESPVAIDGAASVRTEKPIRVPTDLDVERVMGQMGPRGKAMFSIAAWTQLRFGEMRALRLQNLTIEERDLADGQRPTPLVWVSVEKSAIRLTGKGHVEKSTKTKAGERKVLLPAHAAVVVVAYLDEESFDAEDLLFPAKKDPTKHLAYSTYHNEWERSVAAAGVEYFNPHALRHYGATMYAISGATTKELQEQLGHSSVQAAMRYQFVAADRREELAERVTVEAAKRLEREQLREELRMKVLAAQAELAAIESD